MPTIYNYFGIIFYFWSKEHNPIHVHAEYQGAECVILFYVNKEKITIEIKNVRDAKRMDSQNLKKIKKFCEKYKQEIVAKWVEFHFYKKKIKSQNITRKVK